MGDLTFSLCEGMNKIVQNATRLHFGRRSGIIRPLEIKKTASPGREDVRHFQALAKLKMPIGPGGIICLAQQALPITESLYSIPVSAV